MVSFYAFLMFLCLGTKGKQHFSRFSFSHFLKALYACTFSILVYKKLFLYTLKHEILLEGNGYFYVVEMNVKYNENYMFFTYFYNIFYAK